MTIKEQLFQEIESAPDELIAETLHFLRFLKTKETQVKPKLNQVESTITPTVNSTGRTLLEYLIPI